MSEPKQPFEAIVNSILAGEAPAHVKAAAARGALPLPRPVLVRLWVRMSSDEDESIAEAARESIDGLEVDEIRDVLGEADCDPAVLLHFSPRASRDESLAERIVFHRDSPTEALDSIATGASTAVIELLLTNQERLLVQPQLLDRMMNNGALRPGQRARLLELLDRAVKIAQEKRAAEGDETVADLELGEIDAAEAARLLDVDVGELLAASEILGAEEFDEHEDPSLFSAFQRILTLTTAQKAILAMKGGREERLILIRDSNKVVSLGVLKNPRISEREIESIAMMRNVTEDVLRIIGNKRDWAKNYSVIKALVYNPRTPPMISTNFVQRLTNRDLKFIVGSREVPELLRRMAKRTHDNRNQRVNKMRRK